MIVSKTFNQKKRKEMNGPSAAVVRYEEGSDGPEVVASGRGRVANQIIDIAKKNHVHIQEDAALLENLIDMDLGDNVPPQLYGVIAEVLLLIEEMDKKS